MMEVFDGLIKALPEEQSGALGRRPVSGRPFTFAFNPEIGRAAFSAARFE